MGSVLALLCASFAARAQQETQAHASKHGDRHSGHAEVLKRGEPLGDAPLVEFADVLKDPRKYAGKTVRVEGVVERVCKKEGCWVELAPAKGGRTVRVTFKDHGFFVPKDADGRKFRAEGEFAVKTLSKEHVDHLVNDDGARIERNPDGTANEVSFVASGVELWKDNK